MHCLWLPQLSVRQSWRGPNRKVGFRGSRDWGARVDYQLDCGETSATVASAAVALLACTMTQTRPWITQSVDEADDGGGEEVEK